MPELTEIYNFAKVSERLATAGQPTRDQFSMIQAAGYDVIINIADGTTEQDIPEEDSIVTDLGMAYHNLPVNWENPRIDDLEAFFNLMKATETQKVFVHCIANYRVSAFVMLYRVIKQSVPLSQATAFKESVWNPEHIYPTWDTFIAEILQKYSIKDDQ